MLKLIILKKNSKEYINENNFMMNNSYVSIDQLINNSDFENWLDIMEKINDDINTSCIY